MPIDWVAVQGISTSILVLTSVGAIGYAALQLRNEREYRSVENLEKQLGFFLSESFVAARRRLAQARLDTTGDERCWWPGMCKRRRLVRLRCWIFTST